MDSQVAAKAVIQNQDGKFLIMREGDRWQAVGGRLEKGEKLEDGLRREAEEETGIRQIMNHEFFTAVISNHQIPDGDKWRGLALMIYKVKIPEDSKIKMSREHVAYEWVGRAEARKRLAHKYPAEFTDLL